MAQTQIELTNEEMTALEELARKRNVSLSDLIHEGIGHLLRSVSILRPLSGRREKDLGSLSSHIFSLLKA